MPVEKASKKAIRQVMNEMPDCFGYFGIGTENERETGVEAQEGKGKCDKCPFGERCLATGNI